MPGGFIVFADALSLSGELTLQLRVLEPEGDLGAEAT